MISEDDQATACCLLRIKSHRSGVMLLVHSDSNVCNPEKIVSGVEHGFKNDDKEKEEGSLKKGVSIELWNVAGQC